MGLRGVGEVTVEFGSDGVADGEVEGGAEASEGGKPTRRRQAAQVQLFWQEGQRQLIRSSADMWLITCWYERRRHASPAAHNTASEQQLAQPTISACVHRSAA